MRFTTVEVSRAYADYLDSLDDWPPPPEELKADHLQAAPPQMETREETPLRSPRSALTQTAH
jgi:hypothetical protein